MAGLPFILVLLVAVMVPPALTHGGISSCCMRISGTTVSRERLRSYYLQQPPICTIHVVVFKTLKGKRICAGPNDRWTLSSMAYLDGKNNTQKGPASNKHHHASTTQSSRNCSAVQ